MDKRFTQMKIDLSSEPIATIDLLNQGGTKLHVKYVSLDPWIDLS